MALAPKRPSGRPFEKGHEKLGGRRRGPPNKVTRAVKQFLIEMADGVEVEEAFKAQVKGGDRGAMQAFVGLVAHIVGRPKVCHTRPDPERRPQPEFA